MFRLQKHPVVREDQAFLFPHVGFLCLESADAGEQLMGRFGRELFGTGQLLFLIFLMASHILTFTVALNSITGHATCSIVFGLVGLILSLILSLPRTLEKMSWLSLVCEYTDHPDLVLNPNYEQPSSVSLSP